MIPQIRLATEQDAAAIAAIYAPEVLETAITFEVEPPSPDEMRRRIADTMAQHPWLVVERGDAVEGYAYATLHRARAAYRWAVDVSVYLHRGARGRGLGRALYSALFDVLPLQGFTSAYAGITLPNPASVGLHEAMEFEPVGVYRAVGFKLGQWHDVGWWGRALHERLVTPAEPLPLAAVRERPDFLAALARAGALLR